MSLECLDEAVTVWMSKNGTPRRLEWRGRDFAVCARPVRWVDRVPWWQVSGRAPAGDADGLVERQCWRVQAIPTGHETPHDDSDSVFSARVDSGQVLILDLTVDDGWWRVVGVRE
jgi:hypothetical protein